MPATYKMWSKEVLGYVAPMNYTNERYIASMKIKEWLKIYTAFEIALIWNGGSPKIKKGTATGKNGKKYHYNSGNYAKKVLENLRLFDTTP